MHSIWRLDPRRHCSNTCKKIWKERQKDSLDFWKVPLDSTTESKVRYSLRHLQVIHIFPPVTNLTRVAEKRLRHLLDGVKSGLTETPKSSAKKQEKYSASTTTKSDSSK